MRERIMAWQKVTPEVGQTFEWCGGIYKILCVAKKFWLVENMISGRELKVR